MWWMPLVQIFEMWVFFFFFFSKMKAGAVSLSFLGFIICFQMFYSFALSKTPYIISFFLSG